MPRPHRVQAADAIYHITGQGNPGRPIFRDDRDREVFLLLLGLLIERYGWQCYSYCLMTTHYHLFVMTPKPDLARGMQWLNGVYAQMFNRRHAHAGRPAAWARRPGGSGRGRQRGCGTMRMYGRGDFQPSG